MNDNKIQKIRTVYNPDKKMYELAYVTINGKTKVLTNNADIIAHLRDLRAQEGKTLNEIDVSKLEVIKSTNPIANDKIEAWANASRISQGKVNKNNPYTNKKAKNMPKRGKGFKKGIAVGALIAAVALTVTSCGLADKVSGLFNKKSKSITEEDANSLNNQLTDREILAKDFDFYADNYDYSIQMEVAYTANEFLEQANTNIKNIGLKTQDNKDITGLFTEEEAWVYAITINNLSVDQIVEVYSDSKFDYANFEDTKQMMITKMIQYQMLVGFGKVEQLDFNKEFMTPHDDFAKEVFSTIATDIEEIGKNIDNKTTLKEKVKALHDDMERYTSTGNLSQNLQDTLQIMYSPAYFSGRLVESSYGRTTHFTEKFGEELVGSGLCINNKTAESEDKTNQEVQSQHDSAWADVAVAFRNVQTINNESYSETLTDKNSYIYWMSEACQTLANDASREDKYKYAEITVDNIYDIHTKAEDLVRNYLTNEKELNLESKEFSKEFNNIVTDKQDGILSVETILALISDNALVKGYNASIEGYTLEELQYELSLAINNEISKSWQDLSKGSGSTALPKDVQKAIGLTRDQAVARFGEGEVRAAEKRAFDNDKSKAEAEKKAEDVRNEAQSNLENKNYDELKENAGKNDPDNKQKYENNVDEAIKNKEESDKITSQGPSGEEKIDKDIVDLVDKGDGFVEVDRGETPDEPVYEGDPSKIEWSNGETLGGNADHVVDEKNSEPTNSTSPDQNTNQGNVSGGGIDYDVPQDMFEPVTSTYSMNTVNSVQSEPTTDLGSVSGGNIEYAIPEDMFEEVDDYSVLMRAIDQHIEDLANAPEEVEEEISSQKTL